MRNLIVDPVRIFSHIERAFLPVMSDTVKRANSYPPFNLGMTSPSQYVIEIAVAGYDQSELSVTIKKNVLLVKTTNEDNGEIPKRWGPYSEDSYYPHVKHRGIAGRGFELSFQIPENAEVGDVNLINGLLTIKIDLSQPEEVKPKQLQIKTEVETKSEPEPKAKAKREVLKS